MNFPRTVDELVEARTDAEARQRERQQWRRDLDIMAREIAALLEARIEDDGGVWSPLLSRGLDACAILREIAAQRSGPVDPGA